MVKLLLTLMLHTTIKKNFKTDIKNVVVYSDAKLIHFVYEEYVLRQGCYRIKTSTQKISALG